MKNRTVSIIIPAYNEERHLPACLDSISRLDYPADLLEVIVVDNGSVDRTREFAAAHGAKLLRDDSRKVSGLRNLGAEQARGEILAFLDADCTASKEWLRNAAGYFDMQDVVAWGAPPSLPQDSTWVQQTWYLVRKKADKVQEVDWLETMNLFVRRDLFLAVNGFNDKLVTCEDVDFCYRIGKHGRIVSDASIEAVHFGEARTVKDFIRKEIWRGRSNLQGVLSHGLSLKELPSLAVPVYFGVLIPIFLLGSLISRDPSWFLVCLVLYLLPSLAVLFKVRRKDAGHWSLMKLFFLVQIYFIARTAAVLKRS